MDTDFHDSSRDYRVLSVGEWMVTFLLLAIPLLNIVLLFVWAFGGNAHPTKRNFSRAYLITILIVIVFAVALALLVGLAGSSNSGGFPV